ncbi:hypothetical protein [Rhizobium leguminosarum]|uniref:hypothetical protein n=1 Tax=Rhizobium TaxID=379 RepID=UPI00103214C9|nr:hypothetical protein [Rhizobium leguminosarum]TAV54932.1 hypothetical protein ELI29_18645 [Rhizobium leguminosarum]
MAEGAAKSGCRTYVVGGTALLFVLTVLSFCMQPSAEEQKEKKQAGFHCLDYYYGALPALEDAVKETLREPDSFEHVSTRVTPVAADGTHSIVMSYRARNGFGGVNVEEVVGRYSNSDCALLSWAPRH